MKRKARQWQLTLRGLDEATAERIRELAEKEGVSLNKAALRLLRRGAGIVEKHHRKRIGAALDSFIGTWSAREADELLDSIRCCEQIDEEFWR